MRVFVTGASGFVGSAVVAELLRAGHQVLGLVRSDSNAEKVKAAGAEAFLGDVNDLENLKKGAAQCDAVIHTAFNHDFSRFKENCEDDRKVIVALGEVFTGTDKPLVVTSGVGLLRYDRLVTEEDLPPASNVIPRAASEEAVNTLVQQGVNAYIVRLPPTVHGEGDHGFVPMLIGIAREKGESAYIGAGQNRWPAVHRFDAAAVYRLIVEKKPAQKVFHPIAEEGILFKDIAAAIGEGLQIHTVGKDQQETAEAHFGWFTHFASMDCASASELTRNTLGWEPKQPGLLEDLVTGKYFG